MLYHHYTNNSTQFISYIVIFIGSLICSFFNTFCVHISLNPYFSKKPWAGNELQKIYNCEFIYMYDQSKFEDNQNTFIVRCPNCGATIRNLKNLTCEYCMSKVQPINLRLWKMSSYKEDYK